MKIGEFNLHFTCEVQKEFIRQNEGSLLKAIMIWINYHGYSKKNAIQHVVDEIHQRYEISLNVDLFNELDIEG